MRYCGVSVKVPIGRGVKVGSLVTATVGNGISVMCGVKVGKGAGNGTSDVKGVITGDMGDSVGCGGLGQATNRKAKAMIRNLVMFLLSELPSIHKYDIWLWVA